LDGAADLRGERARYEFEDDRKAAGLLETPGFGFQARGRFGIAPLHPEAAEGVHGLGRQAEMAHHGDPRVDQRPDVASDVLVAALELDRLRARLPHDPPRVA